MKEKDIQDIISGIKTLEILAQGNLSHWRYVLDNAFSIWKRCPFQVGDMVRLSKTPIINEKTSWGWLGSKHFLVQGAVAKVHGRSFYDGQFVFELLFEDESWIDHNKIIHPVKPEDRGIFSFGESWVIPFKYEQLSCEAL